MTEQTLERSDLGVTPLIPEEFAARYRQAGYWIDQTIPEFLLDACRAKPHFPALVALSHAHLQDGKPQQVRYSYAELEAAGRAAAAVSPPPGCSRATVCCCSWAILPSISST